MSQRIVKIRHYGFLLSRRKATELPALQRKVTEAKTPEPKQPSEPKQKNEIKPGRKSQKNSKKPNQIILQKPGKITPNDQNFITAYP